MTRRSTAVECTGGQKKRGNYRNKKNDVDPLFRNTGGLRIDRLFLGLFVSHGAIFLFFITIDPHFVFFVRGGNIGARLFWRVTVGLPSLGLSFFYDFSLFLLAACNPGYIVIFFLPVFQQLAHNSCLSTNKNWLHLQRAARCFLVAISADFFSVIYEHMTSCVIIGHLSVQMNLKDDNKIEKKHWLY